MSGRAPLERRSPGCYHPPERSTAMSEFRYIYRGPQRPSDPQEAQQVMQK
jgi:hypothetical protein